MDLIILLILVISLTEIESKISVSINSDSVTYSGEEIRKVTEDEINDILMHYNYRTSISKSTQIEKVMVVKSATVKNVHKTPVILLTQDFDNPSNFTIHARTGFDYNVQTTLTTLWSKNNLTSESNNYQVGIEWPNFALIEDSHGHTTTVGKDEEITESVKIYSIIWEEINLKPGEKAKAELSATKVATEIEVIYKIFYRGDVELKPRGCDVGCHQPTLFGPIQMLMTSVGYPDETISETIKLSYIEDGMLTVMNYDANK